MRPVSLQTSALMLTLIMVLMPMTPFAGQDFESSDAADEILTEEVVMSAGNTGNADSLAFGLQSGCAIGASGNIKCWGNGTEGQLGLGNTQNIGDSADETGTDLPFVILGNNASVDKIVIGKSHSCALFTNGSVKCWGESSVLGLGYSSSNGGFGDGYLETGDTLPFLQFPNGRTATMIEAGKSHTCAVMDNNDLICWGDNSKGQLGLGDTDKRGDAPGEIGTNFEVTAVPTGRTVDSLALGWDHTCVVWDNGSVSCWGGNDNGQLGLDSTTDIGDGAGEMGNNLAFIDLPGTASAITAGDGFTCAIIDDSGSDYAYCWGLNDYGQLGIESTTNVGDGVGGSMGNSMTNADLDHEVSQIDAGEDHVCAVVIYSSYRSVKCWGNGADGRLGYGSQDSRGTGPGSTNGMGSNLPYVRLNSGNAGYAYTVTEIQAGAGSNCVIKSQGNNDIICWGANGIGQLGYGDTEDRGDGQTDLPFITELNLQLNEEVKENSCNVLAVPEHREELDRRLDSDSSDTGDLISMVEIPTTGCPAIAYYDSGNGNLKFAAYDNGMWSVETLGSDSNIADIDLVIDSSGTPHIVHMRDSDTNRITYTTKINGIWTEEILTGLYALEDFSLTIDSNDVLNLYSGKLNLRNYECSSGCNSVSSWSQVSSTAIENTLKDMDTVIDSSDNIHGVFVNASGLIYFDTSGNLAMISSQTNSDGNLAVSIDISPDGSISVAHTNDSSYETFYSSCLASCSSPSSWTTVMVTNNSSSEVILQIDSDGIPWVLLTHNSSGATLFNLDDGQWNSQAISAWPGNADSFGMIINSAGYVYTSLHLVNSGELWTVTNPIVAGAGLYVDADGDGWSGMKEISCGTDRMDSSSTPSDFDEDGRCDIMDTINDLSAVGDSSVLTQGADFACAILDGGDIHCWGLNAYGQLGGSDPSSSWPTNFKAVDIDAGERHACALSDSGEILCWGRNNKGQIGVGAVSAYESPTLLTLPNNELAVNLAAGANHNCVTTTSSSLYCWGEGSDSQTGEYYVVDQSAGYDDDFENPSISTDWTLEGTTGAFATQWSLDSSDASSGSSSIRSNGHASSTDIGFSITKMFTNGLYSFDYKTDTCPTLNSCNDRLSFSIDGVEVNSSKGQMSGWSNFNGSISSGLHTLRWSFIKDGTAVNDATGDYVAVDNIQIRTGFRIESGGIIDEPEVMNANVGGLIDTVVAGERHTCVTNHLNEVWCMGYNGGSDRMVLGNSSTTTTNSSSFVKVDVGYGTNNVRTVTAGYDTSCSIMDNSTQAVCWGQRDNWTDSGGNSRSGELLLGSSSPSHNGTIVDLGTAGDRIYSIAMGESHACAIVENTIECWGVEESGSFGQGSSTATAYSTPQTISVPSGLTAKQIVIEHSTDSTCGVFENSSQVLTVICWGDDTAVGYTTSGAVTTLSNAPVEDSNGDGINLSDSSQSPYDIVDLQSGADHTCALSRQGLIKCWGSNQQAQLGIGGNQWNSIKLGDDINEMGVNLPYIDLGANVTATQLSVGSFHNCAIVQSSADSSMNGKVMCWGYNNYRQTLYSGSVANHEPIPRLVNAFGNDVSKVAAAYDVTCVLKTDGEIYCMGRNSERAIASSSTSYGQGPATTLEYSTSGKFIDLYASPHNGGGMCATSVTGAIKCWGQGSYISQTSSNPIVFYDFNGIISSDLSFAHDFACMVVGATTELHETTSPSTNVGDIVCWGTGYNGQLGTGSTSSVGTNNDIQTAKPINFNGTIMSDVESANDHSCAISNSGEVYCWGYGTVGRLGYGNTNSLGDHSSELPFLNAVDLEGSAKLLALTSTSTCAAMLDNEVYCWGYGSGGRTGHENTDNIGDQANEMGANLAPTDLHMRPTDYDLDGTIDHWDTDDDNDGTLDEDDDFRLDSCAVLDTDSDGMPDLIYSNCNTTLVEDLDDDNDNWNDTDEIACLSNPKQSNSKPVDWDGDGICDMVDSDDDNDGWSDLEESSCERQEWGSTNIHTTTTSSYYHSNGYRSGISFMANDNYEFQLSGLDANSRYTRIFAFAESNLALDQGHSSNQYIGGSSQISYDSENYGNGIYWVNDEILYYSEYSSLTASTLTHQTKHTFNSSHQNDHHDLSLSGDGTVYMTQYDSIVEVQNSGAISYIEYPAGVSTSASDHLYKQIEIDMNGDIHLLAYHEQASRIYTWIYDTSSSSWNSGINSFPGSKADVAPGRSVLRVDSSSQPHVVLMKGSHSTDASSSLSYNFYDGASWNNRFNENTPSGNTGVSLKLDSSDNVHIAWVDTANRSAYYTFMSGSSNSQSTTKVIDLSSYSSSYSQSHAGLTIELDDGEDPWIYWSPLEGSNYYYRYNQIAYFGDFRNTALDNTSIPGDHDGDGICDMKEVAVLDYGDSEIIFEQELNVSYIPEMVAKNPTSISISPALPSGLHLDSTTGEISGRVANADFAGATYMISTTSDVDSWSTNLTIKSLMESPIYIGYQGTHNKQNNYHSKTAFTSSGEIVTMEKYQSASSHINIDGIAAGGYHDSDDIVISMSSNSGDYLWAKNIQVGPTATINDVDVDDSGNIYALFSAQNSANYPITFNFESIVINDPATETVLLAKWDYYGNLQWVIETESPSSTSRSELDLVTSSMSLDKSSGDVAISSIAYVPNDDLSFGGVSVGPFGTCLNRYQPWVSKIDSSGVIEWISVGKYTANDCPNNNNYKLEDSQVILHNDGTVSTAGMVPNGKEVNFGSFSAYQSYTSGMRYGYVAHSDASGNWQWAENITLMTTTGSRSDGLLTMVMDKFSDDSLIIGLTESTNSYLSDNLNVAGTTIYTGITHQYEEWFISSIIDHNSGNVQSYYLDCTCAGSDLSANRNFGYASQNYQVVVDSQDIAHFIFDRNPASNWRFIGIDKDSQLAYNSSSSNSDRDPVIHDFGLDNYEAIFAVAKTNNDNLITYTGSSTDTLESYSYLGALPSSQRNLIRFWGGIDHEIAYTSPSEGTYSSFSAIGEYSTYSSGGLVWQLNDSQGQFGGSALPCSLSFNTATGVISGTPVLGCADTQNMTYTLTARTYSTSSYSWTREMSIQITFGISPATPVVTYDSSDKTQNLVRGSAITPIAPTGITNSANLHHFTSYPPLPSGLQINATGHISGTPNVNQSTANFKIRSCNSWNVCSSGELFTITIDEPVPVISYPDNEFEFFKDVPVTPVVPVSTGGVPSSWEVSPDLPTGLSLRGDGAIVGIAFVDSPTTNYTIWANNSGGSASVVLEITINGTGVFINYPYNNARLAVFSQMMSLYPSTSGAAVVSWSIEPTLPSGLFFGTNNGTIYGTPSILSNQTVYTINATGVEDYGIATVTITVLQDTDLDGIPDIDDSDMDNDGWSNTDESNCGTNETNGSDYPSDLDQDRICDIEDPSDDRSIILVYLSNNLELANNSQMDPLIPITAGGDIDTWEIYPALPLGLDFSGNMPSRSTTFTGIITGTPTEITQTTTYTIWANNTNSGQSGTFEVIIRVLTDFDGDGIPDVYDDDADDDGWSNEMEILCAHDPLDADSVPINSDGDPFCDYIDDDDDGDSFIDTEEIMCNTDPKDVFSVPIDANNNGICDVNEDDQDFDGWPDGNEEACGTDPNDASDVPDDLDGDKECDLWDDDIDGDDVGNNADDFPQDPSASKDTDDDGMPDTITGTSSTGLVEDNDDDDDNWNDTLELECGTNPLDANEFPVDADNSGTCDALELDTDGDGYMDSEDAFPDDSSEWLDTDGDTIGDNADDDDDGDSWIDSEEERCGSDPLDVDDVPNDSDQDGVCEAVKTNQNQESSDETSSITTWLFCLPCLLILLLIPLAWLAKERGDSIMVIMGMRNGPEPENTTSNPRFLTGKGTKDDPYVLKPAHVKNFGDDIESEETITITNLDPDTLVTITDMSAHTNRGRFNMDPIHVEGDRELKGTGSIVFQAKFDDNVTEDDVSGVYDGLIRIGSSSVYLSWEVTVGDPVGDAKKKQKAEEEAKKAEEARLKAEKDAEVKAAKETEAKLKKERKAEKEAADKKAKEEAESKAKAEKEAADKKAKEEAEKEAADKAKEEAESKAKAEKEATEKKLKEAEEKAAAAEAKAKAAEEKAASEKKARENAEDEARAAAEEAAKERLAQMDKEMEERRAKLEEMDEKTRKKEEELLRISEKAKNIDFTTLGVAARSKVSKPVEKGAKEISMGDTSSFDESGNAWVQDDEGGMNISWTGKTATALTGVKGLKRGFAAAATVTASDDLQRIKGVGPFIEDKLNALGIYTFDQVGNMTPEIEEEVNIAIEFFPGRVKRDEWAKQARKFAKK